MDYQDVVPDYLASATADEVGRDVYYMDVRQGGATKGAAMIAGPI